MKETHDKHTETHARDLISRQAAIDAFAPYAEYESNRTNAEWVRRIKIVLSSLPPAEPDGIPLEWINKHLEWLDNCDNEFARL